MLNPCDWEVKTRTSQNYFYWNTFNLVQNTKQDIKLERERFGLQHTPCYDMAFCWPTDLGLTGNDMCEADLI